MTKVLNMLNLGDQKWFFLNLSKGETFKKSHEFLEIIEFGNSLDTFWRSSEKEISMKILKEQSFLHNMQAINSFKRHLGHVEMKELTLLFLVVASFWKAFPFSFYLFVMCKTDEERWKQIEWPLFGILVKGDTFTLFVIPMTCTSQRIW